MATNPSTAVTNPPNPQVPAATPPPPLGRSASTPVTNPPNPQVPAAASPLPPGRPISTFPGAQPSSRNRVGDVRADGAVLTEFLPGGTPVWVIRPAATPTTVNPTSNPQVIGERTTVSNFNETAFAQNNPREYAQYVVRRGQAEEALTNKYYILGTDRILQSGGSLILPGGEPNPANAQIEAAARVTAKAEAVEVANQEFADQIVAAGAGTLTPATNPLLPTSPSPPTSPSNTAPVTPASNPQVPPDGVISDDPLQVSLGGVIVTNEKDLDTLVRLGNDVIVTRNSLYSNSLIRPRNPAVIAAGNELRERLAREEASLERFRNAVINRARTAPPVNPATNPQVPGNYPGTVQNPAQLTPPVVAVDVDVPEPVDPVVNPQVPAVPVAPAAPPSANAAQAAANQTAAGANNANLQGQIQAQSNQDNAGDWRVKLRLAPSANYLYKAKEPGILQALAVTNGVIFPYTPKINTSYTATYNPYDLTHSNVRGYFYQGSHVGEVKLNAIFTAQDTTEANYLLAVIHFFRSVTKMFYGQDQQYRGSPPPLVFLQGLGEYQFSNHPCVVSQFDYTLPDDVDYIRARSVTVSGTNLLQRRARSDNGFGADSTSAGRLDAAGLTAGGLFIPPAPPTLGVDSPTYVPTKMEIAITLLPIQTRAQVSQQFSLEKFGNGNLQKGGFW